MQDVVNGDPPSMTPVVETAVMSQPSNDVVMEDAVRDEAQAETPAVEKAAPKKKAPAKRKTAKGKAKAAAAGDETNDGTEAEAEDGGGGEAAPKKAAPQRKKAASKRKKKGTTDGIPDEELTAEQRQQRDKEAEDARKEAEEEERKREEFVIDPSTMTMQEIADHDDKGRTGYIEREMAGIDWGVLAAQRKAEDEKIMEEIQDPNSALNKPPQDKDDTAEQTEQPQQNTTSAPSQEPQDETQSGEADPADQQPAQPTTEGQDNSPAAEATDAQPGGQIQFKIVNGQIIEDESTLTVQNRAQAQDEAQAGAPEEATEEHEFTRRINNATYLNNRKRDAADRARPVYRNKSDPWTEEDTELFYDALKRFGTDFLIISKMFPKRTRAQVKNKFVREERLDLQRVNNALLGIDKPSEAATVENYAERTGRDASDYTKYQSHDDFLSRMEIENGPKLEEMRKLRAEEQEDERQKKIAEQEKEASKRKKGGGKKKQGKGKTRVGGGLGGGGPVETF